MQPTPRADDVDVETPKAKRRGVRHLSAREPSKTNRMKRSEYAPVLRF